ncbi:MAG: DUF6941 family protein [Isosphaerales bacterium]
MPTEQPLPLVHTFVVCREIFQDNLTGEYILLGPTDGFNVPEFPFTISFAVYVLLTEVRGDVYPEYRLNDSDGETVWSYLSPDPIPHNDPFTRHRIRVNASAPIPRPGRHDLLLLVHGNEIARYPLRIEQIELPGEAPPSE